MDLIVYICWTCDAQPVIFGDNMRNVLVRCPHCGETTVEIDQVIDESSATPAQMADAWRNFGK